MQAGSSTAANTAEAAGERVSDAYSDVANDEAGAVQQAARQTGGQARDVAGEMLATGRQAAQVVSRQFDEQPLLTVLAGLGLGYIAGLLIHGRR